MRYTNIVTSIIKHQEKILLLKRSDKVKTMKNMWSGVSGVIEMMMQRLYLEQKLKFLRKQVLKKKNSNC